MDNSQDHGPCGKNRIERRTRREFAKQFVLISAYSAFLRNDWTGTLLAEVKPPTRPTYGLFRLRVSEFPALKNDFGSVRIGTSALAGNEPKGLFYPILINRAPGGQFYALNSECTHAGCVVRPYSRDSAACACPCHGSRYAIDGKRLSGPAFFPLLQYTVHFDGVDHLTVELPDFPHEIHASVVSTGAPGLGRLLLRFLAFSHIDYEVVFRTSVEHSWERTSFSTNPNGALDTLSITGSDDFLSLYVNQPPQTGFYSVTMQVRQV